MRCNGPFSLRTNASGCQALKRTTVTLSRGQGTWLSIAPVFQLSTAASPFIFKMRRLQFERLFHRRNKATH